MENNGGRTETRRTSTASHSRQEKNTMPDFHHRMMLRALRDVDRQIWTMRKKIDRLAESLTSANRFREFIRSQLPADALTRTQTKTRNTQEPSNNNTRRITAA